MGLMTQFYQWLVSLFSRAPVHLAIVRRYADANGSYVGELYMEQTQGGVSSYRMIGASLDTLPLDSSRYTFLPRHLDLYNDFLAPIQRGAIRVGALDPRDNDRVRKMVGSLPRSRMTLVIQNRFIEHILEKKI
jgi:hypothetical protein